MMKDCLRCKQNYSKILYESVYILQCEIFASWVSDILQFQSFLLSVRSGTMSFCIETIKLGLKKQIQMLRFEVGVFL